MTDLSTLLSRVESGSGADFPLQQELWHVFDANGRLPVDFLTDLNAVIALVEARIGVADAVDLLADAGRFCGVNIGEPLAPQLCRYLLAALIRAEMVPHSEP